MVDAIKAEDNLGEYVRGVKLETCRDANVSRS